MDADPIEAAPLADGVAFAAWTLGQAAVVAIYAAGIKLAGGYPAPVEATADLGLAIAQLVLAVSFAPALFADRGRGLRVAAIGVAWTGLAALLAGRPLVETIALTAMVAAWIAAFAVWRHHPAMGLMLWFLTLAGPILFYLSMEYGTRPLVLGSWPVLLSPPLAAATTRLHNDLFQGLLPPLLLVVIPTAARFTTRRPVRDTSEN